MSKPSDYEPSIDYENNTIYGTWENPNETIEDEDAAEDGIDL